MHKLSLLQILTALVLLLLMDGASYSQTYYGWNLYHRTDEQMIGPCQATMTDPTDITLLRRHDYGICAGAFAGSRYYCYTYQKTNGGSRPIAFGQYDFATGEFTKVADYSQMTTLFYDMTYDYNSKTMYALGLQGERSVLLSVSLDTGETREVVVLSKRFYTLAADLEGHLYAEDEYGELYELSLQGQERVIGGGDYFPALQTQSMSFDHNTGTLYWICPTNREGTQLLTIDKETGYVDANVELLDEMQIVGFDLPYADVAQGAPAIPSQVSVLADSEGHRNAEITVQAPSLDYGGKALKSQMKIIVERDAQIVKSFEGCTPGEIYSFIDYVPLDALYTYTVYGENEYGKGEAMSIKSFVGEDLPASVNNLSVEQLSDTTCKIIWERPTTGRYGGYIPSLITYSIYRLPEGDCIASHIIDTSYIDTVVGSLNFYSWRVVAETTYGAGLPAMSDKLLLGSPFAIPYERSFVASEISFWSVIDGNQDGITWQPTMDNGIGCSYSSNTGDDWLISPPLELVGGTRYKVKIQASSYSYEYEERMSLHLLSSSDPKGGQVEIADFVVGNEEDEKRDYMAYFSVAPESKGSRIAIRMHSDPDKYRLTLYNISIVEASEGSISGEVKAGSTAIPHTLVRICTPTPRETLSDLNGVWSFSSIPEGAYRLLIEKEGFAPIDTLITVEKDLETHLATELQSLQRATLSVIVKDQISLEGIADAKVSIRRVSTLIPYEERCYSNQSGNIDQTSLYVGTYEISVHRAGYIDSIKQIDVVASEDNLLTIYLERKAIAPLAVYASLQEDAHCLVTWRQPVDEQIISYAKDEGTARLGVMDYTPYSVLGTIYRGAKAITSVSWKTSSHQGPHERVDLVLFRLDKSGEPTKEILFEKRDIPNQDEVWSRLVFETPIVAPEGALVALRYNGYLSLYADAGEGAGIDFVPHVHIINRDYTSQPFEYLDSHNMQKNYLLKIGMLELLPDGYPEETINAHIAYELYRSEQEHPEPIHLATLSADDLSYMDYAWHSLPMGYYRYYVATRLADDIISEKEGSSFVGKGQTTTIRLHISTNAGELESTPSILLVSHTQDGKSYQATCEEYTTWTCYNIPKRSYSLHATLDGFEDFVIEDLDLSTEDLYEFQIEFKERCIKPFNLKATLDPGASERVTISWNHADYFFDNLDSYPPFTLEPATTQCNWIYWDLDKDLTREIEGVSFPNSGVAMSFMVFNPLQCDPSLLHIEPSLSAFSGTQYLVSFANRNKPCRNYLFSPIMLFGGQSYFEFKVRSLTNTPEPELIRIGYTKLEYPKTEDDIVWITEEFTPSDQQWQRASYALPKEAKRAVLGHFSHNSFTIMLDDLFVGEETPYGDGLILPPLTDRATYTLYVDDEVVLKDSKNTTFELSNATSGIHKARVIASYKSGVTLETTATFEVATTGGITTLLSTEEVSFYPNPADQSIEVVVPDIGLPMHIYSMDGILEMSVVLMDTPCRVDLSKLLAGTYILQIGETLHKLVIQH